MSEELGHPTDAVPASYAELVDYFRVTCRQLDDAQALAALRHEECIDLTARLAEAEQKCAERFKAGQLDMLDRILSEQACFSNAVMVWATAMRLEIEREFAPKENKK